MSEQFCREHGMRHEMPGDPDCVFEDGMGNEVSETEGTHNVYRDGKIHVLSEKCATCIFNPHTRPVPGSRVAEMVRATKGDDAATVVCHSTLYDIDGKADQEHAVCRGWYDRLANENLALRLARAMGAIEEVAPPTKKESTT